MIYVAMFSEENPACVDGVREYKDGTAPPGSVVISNWPQICTGASPFDGAELRQKNGVLFWHDPRDDAQRAADARAQRDALLSSTDWVVTRAMERSEPVPQAWATYREALRGLTEQAGFPTLIDWPAMPSE